MRVAYGRRSGRDRGDRALRELGQMGKRGDAIDRLEKSAYIDHSRGEARGEAWDAK